jgi:hypothetical protein
VVAISADEEVPPEIRAAAQRLRETPAAPPALVSIVRPGQLPDAAAQAFEAATIIIAWAAGQIA